MRLLRPARACLFLLLFLAVSADAQTPLKREFRGAWVATVDNLDYTTQSAFVQLMDSLARVGINAIVFQVRPMCDAFYSSPYEPWSQWLTGTQGVSPGYDPLQFVINEARSRGMEIHAWFNPYRASRDTNALAANSVYKQHRDWAFVVQKSGGGYYTLLDPGLPAVREHVAKVIMDVVRRYDIDGVHFDDYFYPYEGMSGGQDLQTYAQYNPGGLPINDWRRDNVNKFVKMIHDSIRMVKPRVKFGISPFGIWRNASNDPVYGSATSGLSGYDAIYCDARTWLQNGWLDYLTPQVYWNIGFSTANYAVLVPWWNQNAFSRHIYVGQATYHLEKHLDPPKDVYPYCDWPTSEISDQVILNRQYANVLGSVHFRASLFKSNPKDINGQMRGSVYPSIQTPPYGKAVPFALLPTMNWIDSVAPNRPESLKVAALTNLISGLRWQRPPVASDGDAASRFLVYTSRSLPVNTNDPTNLLGVTADTNFTAYGRTPSPSIFDYYVVTAIDRHQNESAKSRTVAVSQSAVVLSVDEERNLPITYTLFQNYPNPFNPVTTIEYELLLEGDVKLLVFDVLGREVAQLVDERQDAGRHAVRFNASSLTSGIYFYRMRMGGLVETRKMQVVK